MSARAIRTSAGRLAGAWLARMAPTSALRSSSGSSCCTPHPDTARPSRDRRSPRPRPDRHASRHELHLSRRTGPQPYYPRPVWPTWGLIGHARSRPAVLPSRGRRPDPRSPREPGRRFEFIALVDRVDLTRSSLESPNCCDAAPSKERKRGDVRCDAPARPAATWRSISRMSVTGLLRPAMRPPPRRE
jgi:hypothetical protein